jgi:tripartite-type tricarboxylate transporter receptor subunit TctC
MFNITRLHAFGCAAAFYFCFIGGQADAQSPAAFYKGRELDLLIGHDVGGGFDLYARALARHLGQHVPGNPTVIVRNVPGAGGFKLANQFYATSPRDGSAIGDFDPGNVLEPMLGNAAAKYDVSKFISVGSMEKQTFVCVAYQASPVKSIEQATRQQLLVGSTGATGGMWSYPAMLNAMLGTKIKIITGYKGSAEIFVAMERGEVEGVCQQWLTMKAQKGDWIRDGKLIPFLQVASASLPDLPGVPLMVDLAKREDDRKIMNFFFAPNEFGRPYFLPPDVPKDRVEAVRRAFDATMKDPDFLADAAKANITLNPITGEEMDKLLSEITSTPKTLVKGLSDSLAAARDGDR